MVLTANRYDERFAAGWQLPFPVAADATIYKGALVCLNAAGYLVPGSDAAGLRFVGVARDGVDNSDGADGDREVVVVTQGSVIVKKTTAAQTDLGEAAFIADDESVALTTENDVYAGLIVGLVDSASVRLRFDAGDQI